MSGAFDPAQHLRHLPGKSGGDYLDVKWRVLWLRTEYPEATIETELMIHAPDEAIFRARVALPNGASATGWGSETRADFPTGHLEKAETKALGRALAALGYGTQFVADDLDRGVRGDRPVDSPVARSVRAVPTPVDAVAAVLADLADWDADDQPFAALRAYGEDAAGRLGARGGQRIRAALAAIAERRRAAQRVS